MIQHCIIVFVKGKKIQIKWLLIAVIAKIGIIKIVLVFVIVNSISLLKKIQNGSVESALKDYSLQILKLKIEINNCAFLNSNSNSKLNLFIFEYKDI